MLHQEALCRDDVRYRLRRDLGSQMGPYCVLKFPLSESAAPHCPRHARGDDETEVRQ